MGVGTGASAAAVGDGISVNDFHAPFSCNDDGFPNASRYTSMFSGSIERPVSANAGRCHFTPLPYSPT